MRLAIVGSRDYLNMEAVKHYVQSLPKDTVIISGGARGVDTTAELTAKEYGLETIVFRAEWDKFGKSAGFKRNREIVINCDELVAFWDGESRGTADSIRLAKEQGKLKAIFK